MAIFSRVKKLMLRIRVCFAASVFSLWSKIRSSLRSNPFSRSASKIRAFLPRARASLRRNRYGLVPIRKVPAAIWTRKIKLAKLIVLVLAVAVLLTTSEFCPALDSTPKVTAEWVLPTLANHNLGKPIEATFRVTSPAALFVDPDSLRQEGETLGNFEVRGRADPHVYYIEEESEVRKVTEFKYTLQYLKPLDEGVFAKRALPPTYFDYRYRRQYSSGAYWVEGKAHAGKTELYLTKRVQPGDMPFPLAREVPEGRSLGWLLKAIGAVVVSAVPIFHLARFIRTRRSRPKPVPPEPEVYPGDVIRELLNRWWQTGDYCYFLVAATWARIWAKQLLGLKPGELLPYHNDRCKCSHCRLWRITTAALYSGKVSPTSHVWEGFVLFLQLEPRKTDPEQLPPLSKPQRISRWIGRRANLLKRLLRRIRGRVPTGTLRGKGGKDEV